MDIQLRSTTQDDLDFVVNAEQTTENRSFITVWTRHQHLAALASEDVAHFIIDGVSANRPIGYIILAGLADANKNIEFRRIVVTEKNKGYGRAALRLVKELAFEKLGGHRLWLDVKEHNVSARHLYESEGFVVEGVMRECIRTEAGFESLILMSMLKAEYASCNKW